MLLAFNGLSPGSIPIIEELENITDEQNMFDFGWETENDLLSD